MWSFRSAAVLLTILSSTTVLAAGCTASAHRSSTPSGLGEVLPLPSDGWKTGQVADLAAQVGVFHARRVGNTACAWVGDTQNVTVLWPVGYRVAFKPTPVLLDAGGKEVAREGQKVTAGGGGAAPARATSACGPKGHPVFAVQGSVDVQPS